MRLVISRMRDGWWSTDPDERYYFIVFCDALHTSSAERPAPARGINVPVLVS